MFLTIFFKVLQGSLYRNSKIYRRLDVYKFINNKQTVLFVVRVHSNSMKLSSNNLFLIKWRLTINHFFIFLICSFALVGY